MRIGTCTDRGIALPRGDAVAVPFRVDINVGDIPVLLYSMVVIQDKITQGHTYRPGPVKAWMCVCIITAFNTYLCRWYVMRQKYTKGRSA